MGLFPYILLFLQISSLSFFLSLFSFWDTSNANAYLVLSPRFLKPSSFLKTHFFLFAVWLITTTLSSWLLICSSVSSSLLLIFFSCSSIVLLSFPVLFVSSLYFLTQLEFSLCLCILLPSSLSNFIIISLNSCWVDYLSPSCSVLFLRSCLVPLFETYSSISSLCPILLFISVC